MSRSVFGIALVTTLVACGGNAGTQSDPASDAAPRDADAGAADAAPAQPDAAGDAAPDLTCTEYCSLVEKNCAGTNQEYTSSDACMHACSDIAQGSYDDSYDTLGCREAHAQAAASSPTSECAGAGILGGGVCGDRCNNFCILLVDLCADRSGFVNTLECNETCAQSWPFDHDAGELTQSGNTLNCREHYLGLAIDPNTVERATACTNAGPNSATCH